MCNADGQNFRISHLMITLLLFDFNQLQKHANSQKNQILSKWGRWLLGCLLTLLIVRFDLVLKCDVCFADRS